MLNLYINVLIHYGCYSFVSKNIYIPHLSHDNDHKYERNNKIMYIIFQIIDVIYNFYTKTIHQTSYTKNTLLLIYFNTVH